MSDATARWGTLQMFSRGSAAARMQSTRPPKALTCSSPRLHAPFPSLHVNVNVDARVYVCIFNGPLVSTRKKQQ